MSSENGEFYSSEMQKPEGFGLTDGWAKRIKSAAENYINSLTGKINNQFYTKAAYCGTAAVASVGWAIAEVKMEDQISLAAALTTTLITSLLALSFSHSHEEEINEPDEEFASENGQLITLGPSDPFTHLILD